ncbi:MAG: pilin [Patescibacteria group bacterium]|nr:pilin [Patescibacteria group bacterium]
MIINLLTTLIAQNPLGPGFQPPDPDGYNPKTVTEETILDTLVTFLSNLIGFFTVLGGLFFIVYFCMGAFQWISSGGDSGKVEKARNRMMHSTLGLIVMVVSYSLIGIIGRVIGLDLIDLKTTIGNIIPK